MAAACPQGPVLSEGAVAMRSNMHGLLWLGRYLQLKVLAMWPQGSLLSTGVIWQQARMYVQEAKLRELQLCSSNLNAMHSFCVRPHHCNCASASGASVALSGDFLGVTCRPLPFRLLQMRNRGFHVKLLLVSSPSSLLCSCSSHWQRCPHSALWLWCAGSC